MSRATGSDFVVESPILYYNNGALMFEEELTEVAQRQIVMFELAGEAYGIDLDIVQEVIRVSEITRVPQTPGFVEGVINLRGYVVPVVDMKKRFNLGAVEDSKSARIIIAEVEEQNVGISVDKVLEVVTISEDSIEPPSPLLRSAIRSDYLIGFTEINDELVKLLDFGKIFSSGEIESLRGMDSEGAEPGNAEEGKE
ncbi:MAG: chemotaxis protein CheW [bacterium]